MSFGYTELRSNTFAGAGWVQGFDTGSILPMVPTTNVLLDYL